LSTNFYIKKLSIKNFRAFASLEIDSLKRVNVIGGFNGSGKTSLLETIFLALDIKTPISIVKPILWRQLPQGGENLRTLLPDEMSPGLVNMTTKDHSLRIEINYSTPSAQVLQTLTTHAQNNKFSGSSDVASTKRGIDVVCRIRDQIDQAFFVLPENDGFTANVYTSRPRDIPTSQFIGNGAKASPSEIAQSVSTIIQKRQISELLAFLSAIQPQVENLQILQFKDGSNVFAQMRDGALLPIQFLGEGFVNLITVGAGLITANGGVLLMDEIDHTVHYSVVRMIWANISNLANRQNCQIFVTSHSREAINNIAHGMKDAGNSSDFQYFRLEAHESKHAPIYYSADQLLDAEEFDVEIR